MLHFDRGSSRNGLSPGETYWPVQDIIYVSIIGSVMLAALLEWLLWLLAFIYCLVKVFQKADGEGKWAIRALCVANMIVFVALRGVFLPIMIVTLPLPTQIVQDFPEKLVSILQWFAFYSFAGLLVVPWLFCVYQLVTHNVGRDRKIKSVLDEYSAPKVVIIMPCYNEEPEILLRTVDSIVGCEYPPSCLHIFLSFDGDKVGELYLNTIEKLGVSIRLEEYPTSIDVVYRSCRITVSKFPHGGKRSCQKKSFKLIDKVYADYLRRNDNLFLLFIDSDCILDTHCIQNFMYDMELKPGSKHNMLAMTGVITSTTVKHKLITVLQDMEYIHGQLFERSVESGCGAVTCLPGALTLLRFSAFRKVSRYYFADKAEQCDDLFDYGKCHLGEDRWLTHLFMIGAQGRYQIQMNTGAFCKTEAVQTFKSLLKQRRRWFLGFITNEACMLTDIRLWMKYPLLLLMRLAQNTIRTTALLFFIMVVSLLTTSQKAANLPVGFIAVSLGLNWLLMLYFATKLGRYKIVLYPLMFVVNPFFNWLYMVYAVFTAGQRTWGGPRADAGKADEHITARQAVAQAEARGDDLNVVPETFRRTTALHSPPLLPPSRLIGRFAAAEELPGGWYQQTNDSGVLRPDLTTGDPESMIYVRPKGLSSRSSINSNSSARSSQYSVALPRRIESIIGAEAALASPNCQAFEQPAGRAIYEQGVHRAGSILPATSHSPSLSQNTLSTTSLGSETSTRADFDVTGRRETSHAESKPLSAPLLPASVVPDIGHFHLADTHALPDAPHRQSTGRLSVPGQIHESNVPHAKSSPLARKSFTRVAADEGPDMQLQDIDSRLQCDDTRKTGNSTRPLSEDKAEPQQRQSTESRRPRKLVKKHISDRRSRSRSRNSARKSTSDD